MLVFALKVVDALRQRGCDVGIGVSLGDVFAGVTLMGADRRVFTLLGDVVDSCHCLARTALTVGGGMPVLTDPSVVTIDSDVLFQRFPVGSVVGKHVKIGFQPQTMAALQKHELESPRADFKGKSRETDDQNKVWQAKLGGVATCIFVFGVAALFYYHSARRRNRSRKIVS
jgi:hypothetical protein